MKPTTIFCAHCGAANPIQATFCFSCGQEVYEQDKDVDMTGQFQALKATSSGGELKAGDILKQRYQILCQIGQGGFGAVYTAEDKELGQRLLAVKEMSQHHLSPQEISAGVKAFKREALLLAGLMHEHLPRIYDHFAENERWYLVMDYIEGETLEERFEKSRDGSLPLVMALKIALQLCEVLNYLHTRQPPIIFRDLKPANVILTPAGDLFLIDFGIARHFKPGQAKDTIAFGSPGYAAPEQYGKAQTTPRADIYSLGAILHQMLSGSDPSLSPFRFVPLHQQDPALGHLVKRMLEIDEELRPASVLEVRQTLHYIRDHPAAQKPLISRAGQIMPAAPAVLQHPGLLPRPMPFAPMAQLAPLVVHEHHYGVVRSVAWSPDSKYAASATEAIIRVWDASAGQNICSYREHIGQIRHMAWSPTAMRIASISEENKVRIWDASNGKTLSLYAGDSGFSRKAVYTLNWSHDGRFLAVAGNGYIHVWDTDQGELTARLGRRFNEYISLAWSPDGTSVAAAYDNKTLIWQPGANKRSNVRIYHYPARVNVVAWSPDGLYLATGGYDRTVNIWNMRDDKLVGANHNHIQSISALSWSPDSRRIVSGSFAANLNIWDALTGIGILSYYAHMGSVMAVAWSPDGRSILSGGSDRRVCIWRAP